MFDREALPFKIDVILEFLSSDGGPNSTKEISAVLNIPLDECENITRFLVKYNFAQLKDKRLSIDRKTKDFVFATLKKPLLQAPLPS